MEDPWAVGTSWSTPAEPSGSNPASPSGSHRPSPSYSPPPTAPPHSGFESDPWGAPTKPTAGGPSKLPGEDDRRDVNTPLGDTGDIGGGWGAELNTSKGWGDDVVVSEPALDLPEDAQATTTQPRSPTPEADAPWSTSPTVPSPSRLTTAHPNEAEPDASIPLPYSPVRIATPIRDFALPPDLSNHDELPLPRRDDLPSLDMSGPEPDPEEAFAAALPGPSLPKSPSFGDEGFGGFSTATAIDGSDPWGGGSGFDGGDTSWTSRKDYAGGFDNAGEQEDGEEEDEGEGWGGARRPAAVESAPVRTAAESEWESAQRRIKLKEERAPQEKIDGLLNEWKEVAMSSIGLNRLVALSEDQEQTLSDAVRKLESETWETLRSLSAIPPYVNTYPPVISSLTTHERFAYALTRPNPTPSTSLIQLSVNRRARRVQGLNTESPWLSRSKLGEPDAPVDAQPVSADNASSKWSFWGRKQADKPLVTSGGGILEVKQLNGPKSPSPSGRPSSEIKSISSKPPSIISKPSRPSSPSPSTSVPPSVSIDDVGHAAPSGIIESASSSSVNPPQPNQPAQPSAVSRFFGRLSRKPSNGPRPSEVDAKDLELSADDFSYLQEVPSMTTPPPGAGVGDLLSMESGRSEEIASLESMLSSKPTALPAPLAPPPKGPIAPSYSRSTSTSSNNGRFVAKMKVQETRPSDMDLLGGLDFDSENKSSSLSPPHQQQQSQSSSQLSSFVWDDFLAPAPPAPTSASMSSSRNVSNQFDSVSLNSPDALTPIPDPSGAMSPPTAPITPLPLPRPASALQHAPPSQNQSFTPPTPTRPTPPSKPLASFGPPPPAVPSASASSFGTKASSQFDIDDSGDFDDFGTPQKVTAAVSKFDDFDDFASFHTPPPALPAKSMIHGIPSSHIAVTPPPQQSHRAGLDHTPTISLMSGASASKGRRWPAPPSPVAPILAPPPNSNSNTNRGQTPTTGFPFLSPPPPSSRPSSASALRGKVDLLGEDDSHVDASRVSTPPVVGLGAISPPPAPATSAGPAALGVPMSAAMSPLSGSQQSKSSQGGLSATDLSFFDSL